MADRPPRGRLLTPAAEGPAPHPFERQPHRTLARLSLPVLVSLVAEPVTGVVDTAFVARLGAAPLAALGVATALLSGAFWAFNFLGIGAQTEVAHELGGERPEGAREAAGLALALAVLLGVALAAVAWPALAAAAGLMSADPAVGRESVVYLEIRLLSAPAVLLSMAAFGALRGRQDMRTPLRIAIGHNALNALLDPLLIFGIGPLPALGIAGAAWASTASLWLGALWALLALRARLGLPARLRARDAGALLATGRDLFARTGLLVLFLILATRAANRIGVEAGAAHQAIRQVWMLTAFVLDAYAIAAQSLVGFFLGAERRGAARHVARVACQWSLATGAALTALLLLGRPWIAALLVPPAARAAFAAAWLPAALAQPLNALCFATDGILWGARDYRYLRNAVLTATALGAAALFAAGGSLGLRDIWVVTVAWIAVRGAFGLLRIWPGLGASPFAGADARERRSPPPDAGRFSR